jgi:poly-gamma-glutamate synthesis protein (capsule biosynthesis protein)
MGFGALFLFDSCKGNGSVSFANDTKSTENKVIETTYVTKNVTSNSPYSTPTPKLTVTPKPTPTVINIVAVGDDLIHTQIISDSKQKNGKYNFDNLFKNVKEDIQRADISIINQETILSNSKLGYTGYPLFGSPTSVGTAIHNAGFNVVLQATNHAMDKGSAGIRNTLDFWKKYKDIKVLGIYNSKEDSEDVCIIEKKGIKVAILNYTFSLNGISTPKDKKYLVNMLDKSKMKKDISKARKLADIIIVCPHWGTEYVYKPTSYQENLVKFFYDNNVDIIIGTHPHVLEPVKWIKEKNHNHKMLVYYSLGNFISSQDEVPRMLGGMASIQITKNNGKTYISNASITPLVTHYETGLDKNYTTYKLSDYTKELANKHGIRYRTSNKFSIDVLENLCSDILGKWYIK